MPRVAIVLTCEPKVVQELERISRSRTEEIRLVERAKIILCCLSGKRNDEVALLLMVFRAYTTNLVPASQLNIQH
jgi:hypothetical protein